MFRDRAECKFASSAAPNNFAGVEWIWPNAPFASHTVHSTSQATSQVRDCLSRSSLGQSWSRPVSAVGRAGPLPDLSRQINPFVVWARPNSESLYYDRWGRGRGTRDRDAGACFRTKTHVYSRCPGGQPFEGGLGGNETSLRRRRATTRAASAARVWSVNLFTTEIKSRSRDADLNRKHRRHRCHRRHGLRVGRRARDGAAPSGPGLGRGRGHPPASPSLGRKNDHGRHQRRNSRTKKEEE